MGRSDPDGRDARSAATREAILRAAERLFAERGIAQVSSRQIGEAAGQGNTAAVGYHFGGKPELVRAILDRHQRAINELRGAELERVRGSDELRDWIGCFVRPTTMHLDALPAPSRYGRFVAQVAADPAWTELALDAARETPVLRDISRGITRCLPGMPSRVGRERETMGRLLLTQVIAEHERALERGGPRMWADWSEVADSLVAAATAIWSAPHPPGGAVGAVGPGRDAAAVAHPA